ncbi:uroporphyrinogen III methyltransferase [Thermaurantimonas aggregans]|uniref:Uroporphyrinogen III methyltransferase n=1 Tax=Thermaurantimonas aggregans TaxID=2173829 RepID=A0A401XKV8_9FLAO|nr:uroporphyrinogen-III synthase [Thermaurantimonas aggregans]MCX8148233.1 uroporphyrinogen-III synthase [Thermaurantimonas aggregans]GCD77659.1 uroporphyrinogen III methyltransferase [Thermaurantimonas aggregans]
MIRVISLKELNDDDLNIFSSYSDVIFETIYPFEIAFLKVDYPFNPKEEIYIFTSQNAVFSVEDNLKFFDTINCICIGGKTKKLAEERGYSVLFTGYTSEELIQKIQNFNTSKTFVHICASDRLEHISKYFQENSHVKFKELITYKKIPKKIEKIEQPEFILAFSPSGLQSIYTTIVDKNKVTIICIGNTTSKKCEELGFKNYITATKPDKKEMLLLLKQQLDLLKKT